MNILCPVCGQKLSRKDKSYLCENHHTFDIAKEGYLNLNLRNSQHSGDNKEMILARKNFLEKGYYDFLRAAINDLLSADDELVDLACGEGYYTQFFKAKEKIGIDLSKTGLKIASRNDKSTTYLLNSIFRNPLEAETADKVITIFAPIAREEIVRILKKNGHFILVRPDVYHLYELKEAIYETVILNEEEEIAIEGLELSDRKTLNRKVSVNNEDLQNLFAMTPYYNTTSPTDKAKIKDIADLRITFAFIIDIFTKI